MANNRLRKFLKILENILMINIKSPTEIELMAEGGKILAEILKRLEKTVKPGIPIIELDKLARKLVSESGAKPAFLGYNNFPAVLCVSVNEEVVHGIPSERLLNQGDLVSLDMGIIFKGFYSDSAITIPVLGGLSYENWAKQNRKLANLLEITKRALNAGINKAIVGNRVGVISREIQKVAEKAGFGVVRDLSGHGIGRNLHEEPDVPNFGKTSDGPELVEGMIIAIEPMITAGNWDIKLAPDQMTYVTQDGSYSAHFEHTVAVTKKGPRILTQ
jgi:methionyl aminopeptidase